MVEGRQPGNHGGPPSGSPPQPKRHRHSRGKGGPRKLLVRHAVRSMAGVLPKAEAPTVTPRTGQSNRQRKESRLDRASFSCGPGGGLVFSPADTWREHPQAPERRGFHSIQTIQRRGFSGAGPASFFPRGTPSGFSRRRHPNCGDDATAPGFSNRGRGPLLSYPGEMAARIIPGRGGLRPVRQTTIQRRGLHPGGTSFFRFGGAVRFYREAAAPSSGRRLPPFPPRPGSPTRQRSSPPPDDDQRRDSGRRSRRRLPSCRPAERPGPDQSPDAAAAVRSWTMPRCRCLGRQARLASFLRSLVEERSAVTARMTVRRLSLSPSACRSVCRWKGIAGTGSCPPRWMSPKA